MTRTTERWIWISIIVLLLVVGVVLFAGPAARMIAMCQEMMGGGIMNGGMPPSSPTGR